MRYLFLGFLILFFVQCSLKKNLEMREVSSEESEDVFFKNKSKVGPYAPLSLSHYRHVRAFKDDKRVRMWKNYFLTRGRDRFVEALNRGQKYKKTILGILKTHDLPPLFYYVPLIESYFKTYARSSAHAVGIWQFVRPTAESLNLKINSWLDERRDPFRSTIAAAKYLKNLHRRFDSWELALAAYNMGETRMAKIINQNEISDFWLLTQERLLPQETRDYVPKLIAAILIGEKPEEHGINLMPAQDDLALALVNVPLSVNMGTLADKVGLTEDDIRDYNPHIKNYAHASFAKSYEIWLPQEKKVHVKELWAYAERLKQYKTVSYRVRRGDSLLRLASKFNTTVGKIKSSNLMKSSKIFPGQIIHLPALPLRKF